MSLQVGEPSEDTVTNVERVSGDTPDLKRGLWTGVKRGGTQNIVNLSRRILTEAEISKGLKFCPTPAKVDM